MPEEPSGFRIYASNRLEMLAARLAATMRDDPLGPLEREVIVVQSRGMYRWLTLDLARRLGIAATIATPFPGTFCRALADRIEGRRLAGPAERYEQATPSAFDREILVWRTFRLLGEGPNGPASVYIKDDPDQRKRFQLATRLAERFDEYQLYRPDLLLAWERGEQPLDDTPHLDTAKWQSQLWRKLVTEAGSEDTHLAQRFVALTRRLHDAGSAPRGLPRRVNVFGAGSLPPIFLDLLVALARFASVSIYVVSPTREYWTDIRSPREAAKQLDMFRETHLADEYAHVEVGNPLLASLGRHGRELAGLLHERDTDGAAWRDLDYVVPSRATVLGAIQADITELVDRVSGNTEAGGAQRLTIGAHDRSLEIHVCHSPMREMQVLRDVILDAFASDPTLRPHDVFVLAPDVGTYAPYIEAVFGVAHDDEPKLPFTIADRSARSEQPIVDAAFRVLESVGGRATASEVLELLDAEPIRRAAGVTAEQLATIRDWVRAANIRWGMDGEHRRDTLALPCDDFDTWRAGLDRLLLGYAIGDADELVLGILPRGAAASNADLLGRLSAFVDRLFRHLRALATPRPPAVWANDIRAALDDLIAAGDETDERALEQLRTMIDTLVEAERRGNVIEEVSLEVVRELLRARVNTESGGAGFITGAITFCGLKPMRAIPAKIVCIAGLNNGEFPRRDRPASFDLIAAESRAGDRSPREDDRYAFLEAVCSARERLILSYVGRSQKDNSELAPSSVLSELADVIDATFTPMDGRAAHRALTREHALQPFSAGYFVAGDSGAAIFSYSQENCRAAAALLAAAHTPQPFVQAPLPAGDEPAEVSIADLVEFWCDPSRYFCRRVLRLRLAGDDGEPADVEPFGADGLADYGAIDRLVARRLGGVTIAADELELLRAAVGLPHAGLGRARHAELDRTARRFADIVSAVAGQAPVYREPIHVDIAGEGWRLLGHIERVTDRGLLHFRPSTLKSKDYVRAWIPHVALNALASPPSRETRLIGTDKVISFRALDDATATLGKLVAGYLAGRASPPPLFARASFAYAKKLASSTNPVEARESAIREARERLKGNSFQNSPGDADEESFRIVFRDRTPPDDDPAAFEQAARELWEPLLAAATEISPDEASS